MNPIVSLFAWSFLRRIRKSIFAKVYLSDKTRNVSRKVFGSLFGFGVGGLGMNYYTNQVEYTGRHRLLLFSDKFLEECADQYEEELRRTKYSI